MKRLKSFLPMFALIAALAVAFVTNAKPAFRHLSTNAEEWVFLGDVNDDEDDPALYGKSSEHPEISCGSTTDVVCKIIADDNGNGLPELNGMSARNSAFSPTYRPQ